MAEAMPGGWSAEDRIYLERRVEEEIERAQRAVDPKVVHAHYVMTEAYLDRLYGVGADRRAAR